MLSSELTPAVTLDGPRGAEWPEAGLDHVGRCPVCGQRATQPLYRGLSDIVFSCAPGTWTIHECPACRALYLDPRPTQDTIALAYRRYYTHVPPTAVDPLATPASRGARVALSVRNSYLNRRYGYHLLPAGRFGYLVAWLWPIGRLRQERVVRHLPFTGSRPRLLDVGCGSGPFLARMKGLGWLVQGIDPDAAAVAAARLARLPVEQGTLGDGTFADDTFDAVTLDHVIEHVPDPVQTLRECFRVLRPGGTIWVATPNTSSLGHRAFRDAWRGLEPPRHLVVFNPGALRRALSAAGFTGISRPKISFLAKWMFQSSATIAEGRDPYNDPVPLSRRHRWAARAAGLLTLLRPAFGEEVILLARKP